jgi:hypothetical protein
MCMIDSLYDIFFFENFQNKFFHVIFIQFVQICRIIKVLKTFLTDLPNRYNVDKIPGLSFS